MTPEITTILMLLSLFVLITGFPLAFGLASVGLFFGLLTTGSSFLLLIPSRILDGILSEYIMAAIPLFIFMGTMMQTSGVAERAFYILQRWMGTMRGGIAVSAMVLSILFAATTGVVGASVTVIGLLAIPAMINAKYSKALASGVVCAGGTLGILVPPSIMLILYSPMAGVSVIQMFAGAIVPGLLLGISYIIYILVRCAILPNDGPSLPANEKLPLFCSESLISSIKYLFPPVILIGSVLGSIFFGVASPTEAGAVGSLSATILCIIYGQLSWERFKQNCYITIRITSMIILIAVAANIFTGAFLSAGCGQVITNFLNALGLGPWGMLITVLFIIFFMGMFIDWIGILLIIVPIFSPIINTIGFNPLWVGLIICTSLQISFLTPPFAYSIFYLKGMNLGPSLSDIYNGVFPFVALQILVVILMLIFPEIALWLPAKI